MPKIFLQGALKVAQKCEEKDTFDFAFDDLLDSSIEGVLEGAPNDAINNFINILIFQLLLFMFNHSKMQVINRGSAGVREKSQNYSIG